MVKWKIVENKKEWDKNLSLFDLSSYLQIWEWGEFRSSFGWKPLRCIANKNSVPQAMIQFLVKSLPMRIGIIWVPGGPVGNVDAWSDSLLDVVKKLTGLRHVVLKINDSRLENNDDILAMEKSGWNKSSNPLSTGLSLLWNLEEPIDTRRAALTGNWRHNLTRSEKKGLKFELWNKPDANEIYSLFEEMQNLKGLPQQFSYDEIHNLITIFADQLLVFRCLDQKGNLVAIRACIFLRDKAWDIMAAAGSIARKTYATYGTLWSLAQECHLRGVTSYDLGGVDPEGNKGVWNYKKGTGASPVIFLGEWEIGTSVWLKNCVNFAIKMKGLN